MTAAPQQEPVRRRPFADASPAEVRAALIPEEAAEFDRHWAEVMAKATRDLDLTGVHRALESWRRVAWITATHGPEQHRKMLASVAERIRTGERAPGAVSWDELKVKLGLPD